MEDAGALEIILEERERRAARQRELISLYGTPLLSFTMNIPGPRKNSPLIRAGFLEGLEKLARRCAEQGFPVLYAETTAHGSGQGTGGHPDAYWQNTVGDRAFLCVDADPIALKQMTVSLEQETAAGRLYDMDVLRTDGTAVSRTELGFSQRPCLLCGTPAKICRRSGAHSLQELISAADMLLADALSRRIGDLASQALLRELNTTPKPGLVDRYNSGSHADMDYAVFLRSIAVLRPYYVNCAALGIRSALKIRIAGARCAPCAAGQQERNSEAAFRQQADLPEEECRQQMNPSVEECRQQTDSSAGECRQQAELFAGECRQQMNLSAGELRQQADPSEGEFRQQASAELFRQLRQLGKEAEETMLAATGGVNTHKGAIFCLGLAAGAAGKLAAEGILPGATGKLVAEGVLSDAAGKPAAEENLSGVRTAEAVLSECAEMTAGICRRELAAGGSGSGQGRAAVPVEKEAPFPGKPEMSLPGKQEIPLPCKPEIPLPVISEKPFSGAAREHVTEGQKQYAQYGLTGARGQAEAGFPSVREAGLPAYAAAISAGASENDAACLVLLHLMVHTDDTNLIRRGGLDRARKAQNEIRQLLDSLPGTWSAAAGETLERELLRLDDAFIKERLSPGGCADLLALTIFLYSLEQL